MPDVLLIGEAPGKRGTPSEPALGGRIGRRLASLMGCSVEEYERWTVRINLLPNWPGKASHGNGSRWPTKTARSHARVLVMNRWLDGRSVILLGRRVAAAFGIKSDRAWFVWEEGVIGLRFAVAPHPSGASRWWNDPRNVEAARKFWRRTYRRGIA